MSQLGAASDEDKELSDRSSGYDSGGESSSGSRSGSESDQQVVKDLLAQRRARLKRVGAASPPPQSESDGQSNDDEELTGANLGTYRKREGWIVDENDREIETVVHLVSDPRCQSGERLARPETVSRHPDFPRRAG